MNIVIHKKIYNLKDFNHPGGREILELCKNEPDCSALFESYHAFCDMEKIHNIMKKYEIGISNEESMFLFKKDGFYNTCKERVNKIVNNPKADIEWLFTIIFSFGLFLFCQYYILFSKFGLLKILLSICSGISLISLGYNILHDGSHYAISKYPVLNRNLSLLIHSLLLINHTLWSYHHCIRHHQYTGNIKYDPDMINSSPFFRKSTKLKPKKLEFLKDYIGLKLIFFNIIFPGTMFGQSIIYHIFWTYRKRIWRMNLPDIFFNKLDLLQYIISICFIFVEIYFGGFLCFYLHIIGTNIGYFIGSAPDHDLHITHLEIEKSDKITDWGEKQVRHSANFLNNNIFFTRFFGGINYQIEHHLFPTLNNHKLSKISNIVKQTCYEFNIPYNSINNPLEVYNELCKKYKNVHN